MRFASLPALFSAVYLFSGVVFSDHINVGDADLGCHVDALLKGKVIPDVLDMFIPSAELQISYGSIKVVNGLEIKPSSSAEKPSLYMTSSHGPPGLYTLVMADPDAPSPDNPTKREYLHWIVINIPEGSDVSKGKELIPYTGPKPPIGIHRYVFAVFRQNSIMETVKQVSADRPNFHTRQFAKENHLGLPVAALYFNSQKESLKQNL